MARTAIDIAAPPEAVFAVLDDAMSYDHWVVGPRTIGYDKPWPEPGGSLRYEASIGPLRLRDRTIVVARRPPQRLELVVKARPLPDASITIDLESTEDGTRLTLEERPASSALTLAMWPLGHLLIRLRNRESLRRLKRLAEARA